MPTTAIVAFLVFGACFGVVTYSRRHLFSEGSTTASKEARNSADGRLMWVLISSALWPLLAMTGLLSVWRLSRRQVRVASDAQGRRDGRR